MTEYMGGQPPVNLPIAVTVGADRKFTLRRRNSDGDPVDWDAAVYVNIQTDPVTRINAIVDGADALVRIESSILDKVTKSTKWQAIMSKPGSPTLEIPIAVGRFERHDG